MKNEAAQPIVEVRNLKEYFNINMGMFRTKPLKAVDNVSFAIQPGETLGLVGESGCGKTTVGRTILHLYKPTGGEVLYKGRKIQTKADIQAFRNKASMVFQDPYSSLNPRMTVADIIGEPLDVHKLYSSRQERQERILELMGYVGLNSEHAARYAHEFSGGQRQRIGIARAIVLEPQIVVCDEPVSALDVSVQAKVINLLEELQEKLGLSYIFISHDLSVVKHISDTVMVMYLGHTMELASKDELFAEPLHPYTKALLDVIPRIRHERIQDKKILEGDVPSPTNPPAGCVFHTRCARCMKVCCEREPEMREVKPGHKCACHLFDEGLTDEEKAPVAI